VQHEHFIAIVDDDESVREAAVNLFKLMGLAAVAYGSAEEFLASGMIERTSCLVLDIHMPGRGGLMLQNHLKSSGRHVPIVFVTAFIPVAGASAPRAIASIPVAAASGPGAIASIPAAAASGRQVAINRR
jgi:FixJ family two-component response regulator